jgi:hypothetical protein
MDHLIFLKQEERQKEICESAALPHIAEARFLCPLRRCKQRAEPTESVKADDGAHGVGFQSGGGINEWWRTLL